MVCAHFCLFFICVLSVREVAGGVPIFEKESLIDFFDAMNGPSWNLNDDPCDGAWEGVSCSFDNSTITGIRLPDSGFGGQLPSLNLPNLTSL